MGGKETSDRAPTASARPLRSAHPRLAYMRAGATERFMEHSHLSYLYTFGLIFAIGLAIYALTLSY